MKGLSIRNLKIIDSSTIQHFSEILRGVGRNRLDGARKKGGIKVHAMMYAFSWVTEFVGITEARQHDQKFLYYLKLAANSWTCLIKPLPPTNSLLNGPIRKCGLLPGCGIMRIFM